MGSFSKGFSLLFVLMFVASSLIIVQFVSAQSVSTPPVQEFTLKFVDNSYDVAPKPTSSTDPYTGKTTTTTIPGYHVDNKTVEATIKNPLGASYYNFRYKGHYVKDWNYVPFNPNASLPYFLSDSYAVPFQASNSEYTVVSLYFLPLSIISEGQIDVQVQALYGIFDAVPYGHLVPLPAPTYDFYFKGDAGGWSNTQTITIGETSASTSPNPTQSPINTVSPTPMPSSTSITTPTPTVPEFSWLVILPLFVFTIVGVVAVRYRFNNKKRHQVD
jgi:hypothetical protein